MTNAVDVAKYILTLMDEDSGDLISHLKLQKLVYYCQGFSLAILNKPMFEDQVRAWQHGPVVPRVWEEFKNFGSAPIPKPEGFDRDLIPQDFREVIDEVYTVYGQYSAWKLRNMTHDEAPWASVEINDEITQGSMKNYFDSQLVN
ncbi:Panacea domain-containing protein [Stenotrophomonas sp. UBA7606]|uniref:Panacea domain-containing protein n=1 Tax=Stenotrophomonas sp. UBA7606 TaxID=1947559 RepID=UPI0025E817BD|nr:type II toxin-antitoxin system antitoxin SocA domain-containing protein [Stenotrophomonas sp. UBA7606]